MHSMPTFTSTFSVLADMAALHAIREDERREREAEHYALAAEHDDEAEERIARIQRLLALLDD